MGARSARIFERGDAAALIDVDARGAPRIDVRHAEHAVLAGIEIGIEDAVAGAELELDARPLLDLQRWAAEMLDQLLAGEAGELGHLSLNGRDLYRLRRWGGLFRACGAAGE